MNAKENLARMSKLLEVYGSLLTPTQRKIMIDKFQYDLSLQEISDHFNITRSAVLDAIKKSSNKLNELDKKLNLINKQKLILKEIKDPKLKSKIKKLF